MMNSNKKIGFLLSFGLFMLMGLLFQGCNVDDDAPTGGSTNTNNDPTQSITFHVMNDTLPANGALCGLATTASDRDNGVFLRSGNTNQNGVVEFENLAAITYYYNVSYIKQGQQENRSGTIVLEIDEDRDENVNF